MNEPIADAVRGIVDGHIVLTRELAHRNHYPAIDVLQSVSRVAAAIQSEQARAAAGRLREVLATYKAREDLIAIGAYQLGSDRRTDYAIERVQALDALPAPAAAPARAGRDRGEPARGDARRLDRRVRGARMRYPPSGAGVPLKRIPLSTDTDTAPRMAASRSRSGLFMRADDPS